MLGQAHVKRALTLTLCVPRLANSCEILAAVAANATIPFYFTAIRMWLNAWVGRALGRRFFGPLADADFVVEKRRRSDDPGSQHPGRRRQPVHAQDRAQPPRQYWR